MSVKGAAQSHTSSLNYYNNQRCLWLLPPFINADLSTETVYVCVRSFQVLKGGQEAPTKPKGRPKKNSIPTTEEIEAEERRLRLEDEERMRRAAAGDTALARGGEAPQSEPQDLSAVAAVATESHSPAVVMEGSAREQPLPMQPESQPAKQEQSS